MEGEEHLESAFINSFVSFVQALYTEAFQIMTNDYEVELDNQFNVVKKEFSVILIVAENEKAN